jgi:hypothetical protein
VLFLMVDRLLDVKSLKSTVRDLVGRRIDDDRVRLGLTYEWVRQVMWLEGNEDGREVSSAAIGPGLAERSGKGGTTNVGPPTVLEEEFDELGALWVYVSRMASRRRIFGSASRMEAEKSSSSSSSSNSISSGGEVRYIGIRRGRVNRRGGGNTPEKLEEREEEAEEE